MARTYVSTCLCMHANCYKHVLSFRSGIGQVSLPASYKAARVPGLRAVDEGAVLASAPVTSRLFVLPVATRRWVLTDNSTTSLSLGCA